MLIQRRGRDFPRKHGGIRWMDEAGVCCNKNKVKHMKKIITLSIAILVVAAWTARADDAKATYEKGCAKCHGADGKGDTKMGKKLGIKDFADPAVQALFTDADAFKAVKEGLKDKDGKMRMKAIEGLSDDDITALVQYVRGLKK